MAFSHKSNGEGRKWRIFVLRHDKDVHPAMEWLAEAHRLAMPRKP